MCGGVCLCSNVETTACPLYFPQDREDQLFFFDIIIIIVIIDCRLLLAYVMIPTVQREVDTFIQVIWNTHRIREQKETFLPDGVPNHIHSFPEKYGLEECGRQIFFSFFGCFCEYLYLLHVISASNQQKVLSNTAAFITIGVCVFEYHKV